MDLETVIARIIATIKRKHSRVEMTVRAMTTRKMTYVVYSYKLLRLLDIGLQDNSDDNSNSSKGSNNNNNNNNNKGSNSNGNSQSNNGSNSNGSGNSTCGTSGFSGTPFFPPPGCTLINDNDLSLQYSGGWTVAGSSDDGLHTVHKTTQVGSTVTIPFNREYKCAAGLHGVFDELRQSPSSRYLATCRPDLRPMRPTRLTTENPRLLN